MDESAMEYVTTSGRGVLIIDSDVAISPSLIEKLHERGIIFISGHDIELPDPGYESLMGHPSEIVFCIKNREEEDTDMLKRTIALIIGSTFGGIHAMSREILSMGALSERKADFSMPVLKERHYEPKDSKKQPVLLMKMRIPRGIHRDNHGRPQTKKLTPSRPKGRNGSRK